MQNAKPSDCTLLCLQDDTLQSFAEALSIRRKKLGNDHSDVANVLTDLALVHWNRDMFEDALRAMEEAADIYKRTKDKNQLELANTLNSLAALYWNQVRLRISCLPVCLRWIQQGGQRKI